MEQAAGVSIGGTAGPLPPAAEPPFFFAPLVRGRYGTIVIDPPWKHRSNSDARPGRNARRHYRCMTIAEIAALPVGELAAADCRLFLWITAPLLAAGVHVRILRAWRFRVSTIAFTWIKLNADGVTPFMGMGTATRQNAEFVVLGRRGKPPRFSRAEHSVIQALRREHSRKPDELYARIARLAGRGPRADVFAREPRRGWEGFGDELAKFAAEPAA